MITISVFIGSNREGRFSERAARWILQHLHKRHGIWAVRAVRADERGGLPGGGGHVLLRRGLHDARRHTGNAQAEERSHLSGVVGRWPHSDRRQYALSLGQVGCGRFQRRPGDGGRAIRDQGLHAGTGWHSNQLGAARGTECAGSVSRL